MNPNSENPPLEKISFIRFLKKNRWYVLLSIVILALLLIIATFAFSAVSERGWESIPGISFFLKKNNIKSNESKNSGELDEERENGNNSEKDTLGWTTGCNSKKRVQMTHSPMKFSDFNYILPLGTYAGAHVTPIDHLYFSPQEFNSPRDKYPVYAMADGYIIEVGVRRVNVDSGDKRPPEYRIIFQHSCQTISYFDLVTSLDDSILSQIPELEKSDYASNIRVPVKGGQLIGRIGGQTLDTAVYNMDLILSGFITPKLYEAEGWKIHTDDFYSYFDGELKSKLLAKSLRKDEPRSGKIDYDQPGKLVGNWFRENTNGYAGIGGNAGGSNYWEGHLSVTYDAIKPEYIIVSLGSFGGEARQFYVKGNSPDPAEVSSSIGLVKYELIDIARYMSMGDLDRVFVEGRVLGVVLFEVVAGEEKLKVEIFPDKTGTQVKGFTSKVMMYER